MTVTDPNHGAIRLTHNVNSATKGVRHDAHIEPTQAEAFAAALGGGVCMRLSVRDGKYLNASHVWADLSRSQAAALGAALIEAARNAR